MLKRIRMVVSCDLPPRYLFRKDVILAHPVGVVISRNVKMGKNVLIYSNVTIGGKAYGCGPGDYPMISDNVVIYAGAVVIGPIIVGENSIIGAGAVVTKDVPKGSLVIGFNDVRPKSPAIDKVEAI